MYFVYSPKWSSEIQLKMFKCLFLILALGSCVSAASTKNYKNKIIHPCHQMKDVNSCLRDNMAANSKCNPRVVGSIPKSYTIKKYRFETPYFNASYIDHDLVIKNHHLCKVSTFFYNVKSDVAVITVDCPALVFYSNRTLIQHRSCQEDSTYSYVSTFVYPLVRLTVNLKANAMDICNSFVFTDVAVMPTFVLTPNDKPTKNFLDTDLSFLNIFERETFFYRGRQLFCHFINSVICNFGC